MIDTYRYENVQEVLKSIQIGNEFLNHLAERLEDGMVVDGG